MIGQVVGRIDRDPKQPERLTLFNAAGGVSNRFARHETLEDVRAILAASGLELRDDGSVVRREGSEKT